MRRVHQRNMILIAALWVGALVPTAWGQAANAEAAAERPVAGLPPLALQRIPSANADAESGEGATAQVALSHSGRLLAVRKADHSVQVWDLPTGKLVRTWYHPAGALFDLCFSFDDKLVHVATGMYGPGIRTWNVATGEALDNLAFPALKLDAATESTIWAAANGSAGELNNVPPGAGRIDPFGHDLTPLYVNGSQKIVVGYRRFSGNVGDQYTLSLFNFGGDPNFRGSSANQNYSGSWTIQPDVTIGRVVARPVAACVVPRVQAKAVAFAIAGIRRVNVQRLSGGLSVSWDAKSHPTCLAASPDGRFLAVGCEDGHVRIWEMLTGAFVGEFLGTGHKVNSIEFGHDTGVLISGSAGNRSVVIWDLRALLSGGERRQDPAALTEVQFQTAWRQFVENDPAKAIQAMARLTASPETAVGMLAKQIAASIVVPTPDEVERLVGKMRHADYSVRTEAFTRLLDLRDVIGKELKRELAAGHPAEVQLQLKRILAERDKKQTTNVPSVRQAMRALWFLDVVGGEDALAQIKRLEVGHRSAEVRGTAMRIRKARFGDR